MRTPRQTEIRRAVLRVLSWIPESMTLPDRVLRTDAARLVVPAPTTAEIDQEIREADTARLIVGLAGEDDIERKIATAGRIWLAEHP